MRVAVAVALVLLGSGAAALAYAASIGQATFALVLIVPVLVGTGPWAFLGGLLVMAGLFLGFAALASRPAAEVPGAGAPPPPTEERRAAGFVLIGPVPIAFGSTRALAVAMLVLALLALLLFVLVPLLLGARP